MVTNSRIFFMVSPTRLWTWKQDGCDDKCFCHLMRSFRRVYLFLKVFQILCHCSSFCCILLQLLLTHKGRLSFAPDPIGRMLWIEGKLTERLLVFWLFGLDLFSLGLCCCFFQYFTPQIGGWAAPGPMGGWAFAPGLVGIVPTLAAVLTLFWCYYDWVSELFKKLMTHKGGWATLLTLLGVCYGWRRLWNGFWLLSYWVLNLLLWRFLLLLVLLSPTGGWAAPGLMGGCSCWPCGGRTKEGCSYWFLFWSYYYDWVFSWRLLHLRLCCYTPFMIYWRLQFWALEQIFWIWRWGLEAADYWRHPYSCCNWCFMTCSTEVLVFWLWSISTQFLIRWIMMKISWILTHITSSSLDMVLKS